MQNKKGHNNFSSDEIKEVWSSVSACRGYKKCNDPFGREMHFFDYGKRTEFGWNIDHVKPISLNGTNDIKNLQPLHWKSNEEKGQKPNCEKWGAC